MFSPRPISPHCICAAGYRQQHQEPFNLLEPFLGLSVLICLQDQCHNPCILRGRDPVCSCLLFSPGECFATCWLNNSLIIRMFSVSIQIVWNYSLKRTMPFGFTNVCGFAEQEMLSGWMLLLITWRSGWRLICSFHSHSYFYYFWYSV